ncbi:MAG: hypothetical protein E6H09_20170 [Bacteroidetes bacterium]|jgi:hypothetical protein|nr:MAG: hypothetical protein E6H09_20170 [Bacteroidota bacterium]
MKSTKNKIAKAKPDLAETKDDKEHLQPDEGTLNLPDVKDIPGQEHIHVPKLNEFADTTISSDDEEGVGVLDNDDDSEISAGSNVTEEEKIALQDAADKTPYVKDEENLAKAKLDNRDDDGELLNERVNVSGSDLDIPGSEDDDAQEEIGEEDEENNSFSLDGEDEDDSISRQ